MPYSPEDIVAYAFRTRARGYDRDEVDGFLDELADQIEQERARATALEERVTALEAELAEADESERALKRTLITVQDAADRALVEAREEVAQLRAEADREVAELRAEADREVAELRERTDRELAEQRARAEAEAAEVVTAARAAAAAQHDRVRELQELDAGHRGRLRAHLEGELAALAELPDPFADLDLDPVATDAHDPAGADVNDPGGEDVLDTAAAAGADDEVERDPWRRSPEPEEPQPAVGAQAPGEAGDGDADGAQAPGDGDGRDEDRSDPPMWG